MTNEITVFDTIGSAPTRTYRSVEWEGHTILMESEMSLMECDHKGYVGQMHHYDDDGAGGVIDTGPCGFLQCDRCGAVGEDPTF